MVILVIKESRWEAFSTQQKPYILRELLTFTFIYSIRAELLENWCKSSKISLKKTISLHKLLAFLLTSLPPHTSSLWLHDSYSPLLSFITVPSSSHSCCRVLVSSASLFLYLSFIFLSVVLVVGWAFSKKICLLHPV